MEALNENLFFQQFHDDSFDVKDFTAQSIHQGVTIAEQLSRIAEGVSILDRELRDQVCAHHDDLLSRVTAVETLEEVLKNMQFRIQGLLSAIERLRIKVIEPYQKIHNLTTKLSRLQSACDLLRCVLRTTNLCKRLQGQLAGGSKDITKCAHTLSELAYLLEGVDLTDVDVVAKDLKGVRQARVDVEQKAKNMLDRGIEMQNQAQVATALQVFHYLGTLPDVVWQVVRDSQSRLEENVRTALDPRNLSSSSATVQGGSAPGRAAMPTMGNVAMFKTTLWNNMEKLAEQIYDHCSRIQNLQKVLSKKRDPVTHKPFAEELARAEGGGGGLDAVIGSFWNAVSNVLTKEFVRAANESTFVKQAFEEEYPKLLRLHSDLWHRLQQFSDHSTSALMNAETQSTDLDITDTDSGPAGTSSKKSFDPEPALRTALTPFENAYLSRSLSRLFDPINLMFAGGDSTRPTESEVRAALRVVASELSVASVDSRLAVTVAKNVVKTIRLFLSKCEQTLSNDSEATQVIGPPTVGQLSNAAIVDILHLYEESIRKILQEVNPNFSKEAVDVIIAVLPAVRDLMRTTIQPLISSVECAIEAIILTMHDEDFSSPEGGGAQDQRVRDDVSISGQQCSLYMRELQEFITRVQSDYLSVYHSKDLVDESALRVGHRALELFLRHAALVRPLGEGGKRRLATDCAHMEHCLSLLCPQVSDLGKPYRILRAFRPLLFQTPEHILRSSAIKGTVSPSTVMHLLFSRAPPDIRSPHQTAGWSVVQYSQWLDAHPSEAERLELIRGALESYVNGVRLRRDREFAPIYPIMVRVLQEVSQPAD